MTWMVWLIVIGWGLCAIAAYGGTLASFHAMVADTTQFPVWVEVSKAPTVPEFIKERAYGDVKMEEGKLYRKYEDITAYWKSHTRFPGVLLAIVVAILGPLGLLIVGRDFAFFGWRPW